MKISRTELTLMVDQTRRSFIELPPRVCFPGTFKELSESDRVAASWLQGAVDLLASLGMIDLKKATSPGAFLNLNLEFDIQDSETPTAGYEAGIDDTPDKTPL